MHKNYSTSVNPKQLNLQLKPGVHELLQELKLRTAMYYQFCTGCVDLVLATISITKST